MEHNKTALIMLFFITIAMFSCNKTDDGSYVPPITVYEKISGSWQLLSMTMVDETAIASGITLDKITITDQFGFDSFSVTLNVDADNNATSYTVTGTAPELLVPNGYWDLDNKFAQTDGSPVKVNLYTDAAKTQLTNQLSITTMPGTVNEMELKLTHTSNNIPYVSYLYKLGFVNNK